MEIDIENLTKGQKVEEFLKCRKSIFYFINNYCYLVDAGRERIKLYDFQKKFIQQFLDGHHMIVLGSRQTGKTRVMQLICIWLMVFFPGYKILHINRTLPQASTNLSEIKELLMELPSWLAPVGPHKKDIEGHLKFTTNSEFKCESGGSNASSSTSSKAGSTSSGRGLRPFLLWVDEAAFTNLEKLSESIIPTTSKIHIKCKKKGIPFGIVFSTTPNGTMGKGRYFFQMWTKAISGDGVYKPIRMHWSEVPDYDEEWYVGAKAKLNNNARKINQEYELKFLGGENTWLDDDIIEQLSFNNPASIASCSGKPVKIFQEADPEKLYLIGVDTATVYGTDYSGIVVMDYENFEQVAEFKGKLQVSELCKIVEQVIDLYPNSIIIPEVNSVGNQVIEYFTQHQVYKHHLYYQPEKKKWTKSGVKPRRKFGFTTSIKTRAPLYEAVYEYIRENPSCVKSENLVLELSGLIQTDAGRVEAGGGMNDDLVMAFGFCCYVRLYTNHILEMFRRIPTAQNKIKVEKMMIGVVNALNQVTDNLSDEHKQLLEKKNAVLSKISSKYNPNNRSVDAFEFFKDNNDDIQLKSMMPKKNMNKSNYKDHNSPENIELRAQQKKINDIINLNGDD